MLQRLRFIYVWLLRCSHSRGFGIQSPTVYAFVRYVVNIHNPYYAYSDLAREHPRVSRLHRKLYRLYFRIANHLQAQRIVVAGECDAALRDYLHSGCRKAEIVRIGSDNIESELAKGFDLAILRDERADCELFVSHAAQSSVVVIEGIHSSRERLAQWLRLVRDDRVGVSLDLYYCGILFFDKTKSKRNYIVNF